MAIEQLGSSWEMVGLRVTIAGDGLVEFDLVHRTKGNTQTSWPVASLSPMMTVIDQPKQDRIERALVEAVRGLIADMLR